MLKKREMISCIIIVIGIMFCISFIVFPSGVAAKMKVEPIKGVNYNVNASLSQNLKTLVSKKASFTLNSGKTFTGIVKTVGNNLIHLEKLEGKEYYDALIRVEAIEAVDTRFRKPK